MAARGNNVEKRLRKVEHWMAAFGSPAGHVNIRKMRLRGPGRIDDGREGSRMLHISSRLSPQRLDDLATKAFEPVQQMAAMNQQEVERFIQTNGLGTAVTRLSASIDAYPALDDTNRLLLSDRNIYGSLLVSILERLGKDEQDKLSAAKLDKCVTDKDGFRIALLQALDEENGFRHVFLQGLAEEALGRLGADLKQKLGGQSRVLDLLVSELRGQPVSLVAGHVQSLIQTTYEKILRQGVFPELVDAYVARHEVDVSRFTPEIREAMVQHLIARGVQIKLDKKGKNERFTKGGFDEYFAMAYEQAVSSAAGDNDPIVAASTKGATVAPWDFTVDAFDSIEEQGTIKDNILAAGALDYVYELGERMGIFRLVDALTLNWAAGAIDVVDGPCAAKLYRYWKLRDQRMDPSERGLVYKRVLNKGETEALDRMVVNENFEALWGTLAEKVAEYRTKVEDAKAESGDSLMISRAPIHQALRDLQYNLTEFCTGMAHMQVREMYSQLREGMDLLGDPDIIDHFGGGRRKTMWTTIERLSKSEYGQAPNINAIRIAAVEGNTVFRFIANFRQGATSEEEFQRFLEAAEAWIIAKASDDSKLAPVSSDDTSEDDEDDTFAGEDV